jgi:hypothetical protein
MRFQALMPDILHWLGITKIDRMLSMSNMKYDAIVSQGIPIHERVPIPEDMIPEDGQVEIEAKVHAGYFAGQPGEAAKRWHVDQLDAVKGRGWDDIDVFHLFKVTNCSINHASKIDNRCCGDSNLTTHNLFTSFQIRV